MESKEGGIDIAFGGGETSFVGRSTPFRGGAVNEVLLERESILPGEGIVD
jgi:hypothetical protein